MIADPKKDFSRKQMEEEKKRFEVIDDYIEQA